MEDNELLANTLNSLRTMSAELEALRARTRWQEQELEQSGDSLDQLREANAILRQERESFEVRLSEIESGLGWRLVRRASGIRARLLPPDAFPGRCYSLFSRFIKTAGSAGFRVAFRKAREKVARKLRKIRRGHGTSGTSVLASVFLENAPVDRFRELPWRFTGTASRDTSAAAGYFKVLLVSHSACRTGAPLCLLRLVEELKRLPDIECFVVLQKGGELAGSFARLAPTLDVDWLVEQGINRHEAPGVIASAFHEFSSRGVAVCNTLAVSAFHSAFRAHRVEVLSWIHELPTFIGLLGGDSAIDEIKLASRKIMVPSQAVRSALSTRFRIDAASIRTVYNGQDPRTEGLDRDALRLEIRRELGLPRDARIVLGCGTIDLRKGADLFVNLARRVLLEERLDAVTPGTWFLWVGHGGEDNLRRWLLHDSRIGGMEERIRFIGPRSSVAPYYMAADLLALTSREDPCPLVNMEAMESGLAVVAFSGAGGAPEVLGDAGVCVPYIDVSAMAAAVRELLADNKVRSEMGRRGRTRIRGQFTWNRFMGEFRDILQTEFHYRPSLQLKVSVIVPNYRHEKYLEQRIQSVFDQTLKPHEIVVLDDASPDESVKIAEGMARQSPVPMRIVVNPENSGSTFHQWLKGLSLATGDLIWFAESDDAAHSMFLERLVPEFFDPDVILAYCQSALIGPLGERLADDFLAHTDDISTVRWRGRYSALSSVEAEVALSQKNTIPNASAVVFRRPRTIDFAAELEKLKFAGDWLFYALLIRGGKVSFIPEVLNFYRRHEATVSHRSLREDTQAFESLHVKARILETYPVTPGAITQSLARSVLEYDQLTERMKLKRPRITANTHLTGVLGRIGAEFDRRLANPSSLRITLFLGDLKASRANNALIDLANALSADHTVLICNAQPSLLDQGLLARMDSRLIPLEGTLRAASSTTALDPAPAAGSRDLSLRANRLSDLIRILRVDVLHSHSLPADRLVLATGLGQSFPWLVHPKSHTKLTAATTAPAVPDDASLAILNGARGFFFDDDCQGLPSVEIAADLPDKPRWLLPQRERVDQIAAVCAEAYLEIANLIAFPRELSSDNAPGALSNVVSRRRPA